MRLVSIPTTADAVHCRPMPKESGMRVRGPRNHHANPLTSPHRTEGTKPTASRAKSTPKLAPIAARVGPEKTVFAGSATP